MAIQLRSNFHTQVFPTGLAACLDRGIAQSLRLRSDLPTLVIIGLRNPVAGSAAIGISSVRNYANQASC